MEEEVRCKFCNRRLTYPESKAQGYCKIRCGPDWYDPELEEQKRLERLAIQNAQQEAYEESLRQQEAQREYDRLHPPEPVPYKTYDCDTIGWIGIETTTTCQHCNKEFTYYYKGGRKRLNCPECGGIRD